MPCSERACRIVAPPALGGEAALNPGTAVFQIDRVVWIWGGFATQRGASPLTTTASRARKCGLFHVWCVRFFYTRLPGTPRGVRIHRFVMGGVTALIQPGEAVAQWLGRQGLGGGCLMADTGMPSLCLVLISTC